MRYLFRDTTTICPGFHAYLWLLYTAFTEDIFKYTATLEIANTQFINTIKMWIDVVQGKCRVNKKIGSTRNFSVDISFI